MTFVQTIMGRIHPEDMGITYTHEHLYTNPPAWVKEQDPDLVLQDAALSLKELKIFENAGGGTLVEMTAIDYGRNIHALRAIAAQTKVNIIAATGFNKGLFFDKWVYEASINDLAEMMVKEITEGIDGTDSKAGVIKVGTGYNHISSVEEKVIRAGARAHKATGAPISTHTEAGTMALEQLEILKQEGVEPENVIIGHADRNLDLWYFKEIVKRGAYVEFDGLSKVKYYPDEMRVQAIIGLIQAGYKEKILFSGDMARKSYLESYGGGPGFRFILEKFIPRLELQLEELDLDREYARQILTINPRKAFCFRE
jgi:phosphotriesterase-related protein